MKKEFKNQLTTAILSSPIVYIPHFHYHFVDEILKEVIQPQDGHRIFDLSFEDNVIEFDSGRNCIVKFESKKLDNDMSNYDDASSLLKDIVNRNKIQEPVLLVLKNFSSQLIDSEIQSLLASFAYQYEKGEIDKASTIIIVSPKEVTSLPKEIEKYITVIDIKAPDYDEIMELINEYPISARHTNNEAEVRTDLCRTLQGLQLYEIQQILYSALVRTGMKISAKTKRLALEEKKNIVRKSGIIEVVDANESFDQIGGLEILKDDLRRKAKIFTHLNEAQANRVNLPKGVLIIGMPGCGKTMIAKSIANEFGVSLLRLDVNRLMGKYVGESETNLRNALATAEAAHPCVLWIDEIEKAFAGSNGQNSDMLVMRLMGHFLTWMQERTTPVFIVATANDVMRPEFMRKGRFDEVYFVDFPNEKERKEILLKTLEAYRNDENSIFDFSEISDFDSVVKDMKGEYGGFSGAEIKSTVNMVVESKFGEYVDAKSQNPENNNPIKVKVRQEDFSQAVTIIKDSVMANQKSKEYQEYVGNKREQKNESEWTNIERIMFTQKRYNFKKATK
jgi:SpoVK/Ycf46/Vps4 family AAA+-type ATPase